MKYGTYTNTRNSAWQCLIDCNISELPIKPVKIAKLYNLQCKKADNKVLHGDAGKIKKLMVLQQLYLIQKIYLKGNVTLSCTN
ncbi:MAG: hypothetical protein BHV95_02720 [Clostridiales bacterium Nov_37_41]|jgi:hypothetical protein|nr:MAG: hypothetical protein BHV95_02720 [Clostridiales bacterium Nov_37_41]